ncbi:phage tail tape measure protein [Edwardsiella hoshinae]|uniref:Phage-related minor tail protein n=4 Tax=Edwardsiella hoshinae TaxID=93378 RepID=A0A376DJ80_9GAMM|nr:phage tail tape measure protein [Edwardsiella hoshinae]QPR26783.1 phage tail tape measure protein [Edwardsiella hoshinae]STC89425.1 Phage-related minor tail protein [Edwardsiella hoshinae]
MARDFKVSMTLEAKDDASRQVTRTLKETTGQAEKAAKAIKRQGHEQQKTAIEAAAAAKQQAAAAAQAAKQSIAASRSQMENARRLMRAREALGIRSEQSIQREIARTIASYNRLTRAGTLSAREQARAYHQMRQQVAGLRQELKGVTTLQQARGALTKAGVIAGGAAAFGAAFVNPVRNRMTYDERLTAMSNDAFNDKSLQERQAGKQRLDKLIQTNVKTSGLSKEAVMEGADTLLKNGMKEEDVTNLLPMVTRYSVAANAAPQDIANVLTKMKDFGIKGKDIETAMNMMIASGQAGNFEVKDMARYLPTQMASGASAGFYGLEGLKTILALNQVAVKTAGNNDEAGNNVNNLIAKMNARDTENNAKTIPLGGNKVLKYTDTLIQAKAHGMNALEATSAIIDRVMAKDKRYQKLKREMEQLDPKDTTGRREKLESMNRMLSGSVISQLFPDRQAMMAFLAYRYSGEYRASVEQDIEKQRHLKPGERGAGDENFAFIEQQDYFKLQQLNNTKDLAELNMVKPIAEASGNVASKLNVLATEFPALATAASGATTAIQGMTQAAIAFAGIKLLTGGIKAAKGVGGAAAAEVAAAGTNAVKGTAGRLLSKPFMKWIPIIGELIAAAQGTQDFPVIQVERASEKKARIKASGIPTPHELQGEANSGGLLDVWDEAKAQWKRLTGHPIRDDQIHPQQVIAATQPPQAKGGASQTTASPTPSAAAPQVIRLEVDGRTLAEIVNQINAQEGVRG